MTKLKIVHLITGLNVGGAERMLHKLLANMDRDRFQNVVISLIDAGSLGERIEELGIPVFSLGMRRGRPGAPQLITALRLLARERPSILQTWMYHADLLGLICKELCRIPYVVWNLRASDQILHSPRMTVWTFKACARLSRRPSVVIANSQAGQAFHASNGYHPRRWLVIPNGFDLGTFAPDFAARASVRADLGLCPDDILIGLVGRYDPMKDHETFFQAAMLLAERDPRIHFLLAGREVVPGNVELTRSITGHKVYNSVHMLGERADIPRLMSSLDIYASSSSYGEGFANVVGEAMACGVPCVVTDVGDSAAIVGDTGVVVPPRDPRAMADAWERLIEAGPEARHDLGQAARRRIVENYSLESVVRRYEDLYLELSAH